PLSDPILNHSHGEHHMSENKSGKATSGARTPGAKRAAPGEHYFDMTKVNSIMGGPAYSSVFGGCVEGDRMIAALMRMPAGTGAEPHSHPQEEWIYVIEGTFESHSDAHPPIISPRPALSHPPTT